MSLGQIFQFPRTGRPKGSARVYPQRDALETESLHRRLVRLRRAGTENIPGIIGLGKAAELAVENMEEESSRLTRLRDKVIEGIKERIPHVRLTGHPVLRLPNHASFCFEYIEGESMLLYLDMEGIASSSGSAAPRVLWNLSCCWLWVYRPNWLMEICGLPWAKIILKKMWIISLKSCTH